MLGLNLKLRRLALSRRRVCCTGPASVGHVHRGIVNMQPPLPPDRSASLLLRRPPTASQDLRVFHGQTCSAIPTTQSPLQAACCPTTQPAPPPDDSDLLQAQDLRRLPGHLQLQLPDHVLDVHDLLLQQPARRVAHQLLGASMMRFGDKIQTSPQSLHQPVQFCRDDGGRIQRSVLEANMFPCAGPSLPTPPPLPTPPSGFALVHRCACMFHRDAG